MGKRSKQRKQKKDKGDLLFYVFFGYLLLFLPVFHIKEALDISLMPRLLALSVLLFATGIYFFGTSAMHRTDFSILRKTIFPVLAAFLLITIMSSFFAINTSEVYFDIVKALMLLGGIFFATLVMIHTDNWVEKLTRLAILSAIITVTIGGMQYLQRVIPADEALLSDGRSVVYSVTGLMSHKNMYSSFLMLLLPFTALGVYSLRGYWRITSVIVSILILVMIALLKTRSVWVGIAFGGFVAIVLFLIRGKAWHVSPVWRKGLTLAMVLGLAGIAGLVWVGRSADEFSMPGRISSVFDIRSNHNIHRIKVWSSTVDMIRDHPITGVGPGNWKIKAPNYFEVSLTGWKH